MVIALYSVLVVIGWGLGFRRTPHAVSFDIECETLRLPPKPYALRIAGWKELRLWNGQGSVTMLDKPAPLNLAPGPNQPGGIIHITTTQDNSWCKLSVNGAVTLSMDTNRTDDALGLRFALPPVPQQAAAARVSTMINDCTVDASGFAAGSMGAGGTAATVAGCSADLQQGNGGRSESQMWLTYAAAPDDAGTNAILTKLAQALQKTAPMKKGTATAAAPATAAKPSRAITSVLLKPDYPDPKAPLELTFTSGSISCTRCKGFVQIGDAQEPVELKGFPDLKVDLANQDFVVTQIRAAKCAKEGVCSNNWVFKVSGKGHAVSFTRDNNNLIPTQLSEILERPLAKQDFKGLLILALLFLAYKFVEPAVAAFVKLIFPESKEG